MKLIRRYAILFFLLIIIAYALGCGGQGRAVIPIVGMQSSPVPLHTCWARVLVDVTNEDRWRPMQYAMPVVDENVVYLGNTLNVFYAFAADTGEILWSFKTAGPVECGAVVVGNTVVFGDGDGLVYCLDKANGKVKWTYRVQGQVMGKLASNGELVYIRTNHERLYAIKLADGKWKWMQSRELPANFTVRGDSSPVVDNGRVLIGFADGYFFAFDADTGSEMFKTLLQKGERLTDVDATPIVDGEYMYVSSYGGTFYCLSRDNAAVQWTFNKGGINNAAIYKKNVYVGDDQGFVHALNKKTGELLWSFDLREHDLERSVARSPRRTLKIATAPLVYYGVLLVASSNGYLYGLDLDSGKIVWRFWPGYGVTAGMRKAEDKLMVHTNYGTLYCLEPNVFFHPTENQE